MVVQATGVEESAVLYPCMTADSSAASAVPADSGRNDRVLHPPASAPSRLFSLPRQNTLQQRQRLIPRMDAAFELRVFHLRQQRAKAWAGVQS